MRPPSARRTPRRGAAAVEFMMILPAVLLVSLGMLTLGNYLTTRHHLGLASGRASRTCSLDGVVNRAACVQAIVAMAMPPFAANRCGALRVNTAVNNLPNTPVRVLEVEVVCAYTPLFGGRLLGGEGITLQALTARGAMPLQQ